MLIEEVGAWVVVPCTRSLGARVGDNQGSKYR